MRRIGFFLTATCALVWPAQASAADDQLLLASSPHLSPPQVAVDDRGNATVIWNDIARGGVVYARTRAFGGPWSGPRVLSPNGGEATPQLSLAPTGDVSVSWVQDDAIRVVVRRKGTWSAEQVEPLLPNTGWGVDGWGAIHRTSVVSVDDVGGESVLVQSRPFGSDFRAPRPIAFGNGNPFRTDYGVNTGSFLSNGTFLMTWCGSSKCYYQTDAFRPFADGTWRQVGAEIDGNIWPAGFTCLDVVRSPSGFSELSYVTRVPTGEPETSLQAFHRGDGRVYGRSLFLESGPALDTCPSGAVSDLGHAVLAFQRVQAPTIAVWIRRPDGTYEALRSVSDPERVNASPVSTMSGRGDALVAWLSTSSDGTRVRVHARSKPAGGQWSDLRLISLGAPAGTIADLAGGAGRGTAAVAWNQRAGGQDRLWVTSRWIAAQDTTLPRAPIAVTATQPSLGRIEISWSPSPSSDVTGYRVLRNGAVIATTDRGTSFDDDTTFVQATALRYRIVAVDASGNQSERSPAAEVIPVTGF